MYILISQLMGGLEGGAAPTGGSMFSSLVPFIAVFVIFYFLLIRPQQKKQKETKKMLEAIKRGDKIVTIGGIKGTLAEVKKDTVIVKVDDNTKMEFLRSAISDVLNKEEKESKETNDVKESEESESK